MGIEAGEVDGIDNDPSGASKAVQPVLAALVSRARMDLSPMM